MQVVAEAFSHFAQLFRFRVFLLNVLGQTLWVANVGALAFWGPKVTAPFIVPRGDAWFPEALLSMFGLLNSLNSDR